MNNNFLDFLDQKQKTYIEKHQISNDRFIDYSALISTDLELGEQFYIAKGSKSRILINHENIWVDLTDYDLIYLFCQMETDTVKKLLTDLKDGYQGSWSDFGFQIESTKFQGKGIGYQGYDLKQEIMLEADFAVTLGDILFVFNMVLYKDMVGQEYLKKSLPCQLIERTVIKYMALILYYRFEEPQAQEYLDNIEYPVFEKNIFLDQKMTMKKYDNNFVKDGFDKLLALC